VPAAINSPINTIADEFNGNIDNDNIKTGAAIDGAKLAAASIPNAQLSQNVAWTAWTPTLTNLTLGSGTVVAKYQQIGKTVKFRFEFTLGAGSAVGTSPTFSLPVIAASMSAYDIVGRSTLNDTGTRQYLGFVNLPNTTTAGITAEAADSSYVYAFGITATAPHTWATTDVITAVGQYEAA
jgi:hypothetical protein